LRSIAHLVLACLFLPFYEHRLLGQLESNILTGERLVAAARQQVGKTTVYDPAYVVLAYPDGDVPTERGVCTDVIVRAFREAFSMDLQMLVHRDMTSNFSSYPRTWGLTKPDRNIDHRRVGNLQAFFKRKRCALRAPDHSTMFQPGDLVTCTVPPNLPHIMLVSDKLVDGRPMVIHNIGSGTKEEDCLLTYPLTGHYRWK
jgi:uncharacterized protein YijF (DUF1287 family)